MLFPRFSALQRAEIAEIRCQLSARGQICAGFSALQRAEIAEIPPKAPAKHSGWQVSVLFNEPKLLKLYKKARLSRYN